MINATTLTAKGQITVPQVIRKQMDLKPGDKITFSLLSDGTLVVRPKVRRVADLVGILHQPGMSVVPVSAMRVVLDADEGAA
ncbi:MAG: type II toxin-antitoxin system PrlF family antitoxin [Pseudomonadales bacterium]|jgi:AbrB family looped-hinge helix DNA binding protein|nr:type II toxin-antitoxin system PrlF family antitoxin [Pseudomonadales bacterium]